jgi:aspartyl-tRNA(Asn)/glutamyl-tRNA(Gln) amidotransferase subunit B
LPESAWEIVVGMEVHAQPATRSKMFCDCPTDFLGGAPNTNVCEVCLGLPGVLPAVNKAAVEQCLRTALALECSFPPATKWDRKNYFYPDLPKGYQISQYDLPMSTGGTLSLDGKPVRIRRVHLEEDTGSLVHAGDQLQTATESFVNLNRAGVPLMEIVTEPDLRSADEARDFAMSLRAILRYIGASEADMEKGQLRAEPNVSVRRRGSSELGVKTELKNINSFRALHRAIEHEVRRQVEVLEGGGEVVQETRGWSEADQRTFSQRTKEYAEDYRYFPEPDLPPLVLDPAWISRLRSELPELPAARLARFQSEYGLSAYDAGLLVEERTLADYYEDVVRAGADSKPAANWVIGELRQSERRPSAADVARLVAAVQSGSINREQGRESLAAMIAGAPFEQATAGKAQLRDEGKLAAVVEAVIAANAKAVADYKAGNERALNALVGQVMKETRGSADTAATARLLRERLSR